MGKMLGGGVEAVVMNYYRHVDRSKVQFDFLVDSDSTLVPRDEIESLGGRVFVVPPYQRQFSYQRKLEALFQEQRCLIVHSHVNTLSVFPLRAAKRAGVPVRIAHSHSTANPDERAKTAMKDILRTQANRYPTERFACGKYAGEWLFGKGSDFTVIPNAIDLRKFVFSTEKRNALRAELGINGDSFVVLHMGRFVEQKNHRFLVEIFAELLKERPGAVLLLAGEGPLRSEIELKVESLGIADSVRFLGQRPDADALYSAADVFCLPSLYEGLPVVAVEAQASGLPMLMSDKVTHEALISSRAWMLPLTSGAAEWAGAVDGIGGDRFNPMGEEDERAISRYDIENAAPLLTQKYLELARKVGVTVA
jgi:glycosyltransferase EpsF